MAKRLFLEAECGDLRYPQLSLNEQTFRLTLLRKLAYRPSAMAIQRGLFTAQNWTPRASSVLWLEHSTEHLYLSPEKYTG
jgi:hypothetical protein